MRLRLLLPLTLLFAVPAAAQDYPPRYGYAQSGYDTDGQSVDSIDVFFEPLARYGRWVDSRFGRGWTPNVGRDWRPYTIGHWEQGAYGQTWRSDEPFGWAVFHFGRWGFDPAIGWVWTPDTTWGPGWVAWRDSDDVTGWAPLPPSVGLSFSFGGGYGDGYNNWGYDQWYQPSWVYVPRGNLYGRSLRGAILPYGRNRDYWAGTRGVTRYDRLDGRVFNRSFDGRDRRDPGRGDRRGDFRAPNVPPPFAGDRRFDGRVEGRDARTPRATGGDPRGDARGEATTGFGRRNDPRQSGGVMGGGMSGDVRGAIDAPRRDFARPADGMAPSINRPRDFGRGGFQQPGGFVPFQPQGGRDLGRRAPPDAAAPQGNAVTVRPQAPPPMIAPPRSEAPPAAPEPRAAPTPRAAPEPRLSPQKQFGDRNRDE